MVEGVKYQRAYSIENAIQLLKDNQNSAIPYAGGTDIIVGLKKRKIQPELLVDLKGIPQLNEIQIEDKLFSLGSLVTISQLAQSKELLNAVPVLSEAALRLGSQPIRNRATVGGNLCNASPSADMAPVLMVLEARLEVMGADGIKEIPIEEFFMGPGSSVLRRGELLTKICFMQPHSNTGFYFTKLGKRNALDIAIINVACAVTLDQDNVCQKARIALGAVAPVPMRAVRAENVLAGRPITAEAVQEAAVQAMEEVSPIDDIRASASYRREMTTNLVAQGLAAALSHATGDAK